MSTIEVFWRPGCPFCLKLRLSLLLRRVPVQWRNIWRDEEARQIVREANGGNETVPTVRVGAQTLINPGWRQIKEARDRP